MARLHSTAVGGYYPTPTHLIEALSTLVVPARGEHVDAWLDPCAGQGEALSTLARLVYPLRTSCGTRGVNLYAIEIEKTRFEKCRDVLGLAKPANRLWDSDTVVHADALRVEVVSGGATVLYLNPPYDLDPRFKRLEERFLRRYTPALLPGGVLLYLVPAHALPASQNTLATHYGDVSILRFPDPDYEVYKQVVVVARALQHPNAIPDSSVLVALQTAANNPMALPLLGGTRDPLELPAAQPRKRYGTYGDMVPGEATLTLKARGIDLGSVRELHRPWHTTDRMGRLAPLANVFPEGGSVATLAQRYPVAVPPKPAHIAAGIAAGLFNGSELTPMATGPDAPPPLLVKGVFAREWRTIEEKKNKDGETTGEVQIEEPKLQVTVLDLKTSTYSTLQPSPEPSGTHDPTKMTTGDLLTQYGESLLASLREHCPVDYDPHDTSQHFPVLEPGRPLYDAQRHAARALIVQLGGPTASRTQRRGRYAPVLGEIGSGKSSVFLTTCATIHARFVLVMCPPHLLTSWSNEVRVVWPEARVVILDSLAAVDRLAAERATGGGTAPVVALLSRETAKLGHAWEGLTRCPRCGTRNLNAETNAAKRQQCEGVRRFAKSPAGRMGFQIGAMLGGHPEFPAAVPVRWSNGRKLYKTPEAAVRAVYRVVLGALQGGMEGLEGALGYLGFALDDTARMTAASALLDRYTDTNHDHTVAGYLLAVTPPTIHGWEEAVTRLSAYGTGEWDIGRTAKRTRETSEELYGDRNHCWGAYDAHREYSADGEPPGRIKVGQAFLGDIRLANTAVATLMAEVRSRTCNEILYQAIPEPRRYPLATYIARRHKTLFDILAIDECFPGETQIATSCGPKAIRDVVVGDHVWSRTHSGELVMRPVVNTFRKHPTHGLVHVVHEHGWFDCTPNHRVWDNTAKTYTKAGFLTSTQCGSLPNTDGHKVPSEHHQDVYPVQHRVSVRSSEPPRTTVLPQRMRRFFPAWFAKPQGGTKAGVPHCMRSVWERGVCSEGVSQPPYMLPVVYRTVSLAEPREQTPSVEGGESARHPRISATSLCARQTDQRGPRNTSQDCSYNPRTTLAWDSWGEWAPNTGTANSVGGPRELAYGVPHPHGEPEMVRGSGRHSASDAETRDRVRRGIAPHTETEEQRSHQSDDVARNGVGGASLLELRYFGNSATDCDCGVGSRETRVTSVNTVVRPEVEWVYDIEVEDTHNYFAAGILVHNCQEMGNSGAAQTIGAGRLVNLRLPTVLLSGSLVNGYAEHLFASLWACDKRFRDVFPRNGKGKFVERYGYQRRLVTEKESDGKARVYGAQSDRVQDKAIRDLGSAPGVQPQAILEWLLPHAVTLHKTDLAINIPPNTVERVFINATPTMESDHKGMVAKLLQQIRRDAFGPLSGALWGQLAEAPSHLDRFTADTGNCESGAWEVRYPEARGGELVTAVHPLPANTILPKEQWMLDTLRAELAEGRPCMVLGWHIALLHRWLRLCKTGLPGVKVVILEADKVSPAKRQVWIEAQLAKGMQVLLTNPVAIQTGLNCLTEFCTQLWMQNPGCNAIVFRQACGRIDRIGQTRPTKILCAVYRGTAQEALHRLLLQKVAVSQATDGLDARSALQAAGVGESATITSLSVGKLLFEMLEGRLDLRLA